MGWHMLSSPPQQAVPPAATRLAASPYLFFTALLMSLVISFTSWAAMSVSFTERNWLNYISVCTHMLAIVQQRSHICQAACFAVQSPHGRLSKLDCSSPYISRACGRDAPAQLDRRARSVRLLFR